MITIRIDEKDSKLLTVTFAQDPVGNEAIRSVLGRRWSYTRRCWVVPNTRDSIVRIGQLFGRDYCRFDEAVVRLYKPDVTIAEIELATNPPWPPLRKRAQTIARLSFRYSPPLREFDRHPVIESLTNAMRLLQYSYKTIRNYRQAMIALLRYVGNGPLDKLTRQEYQSYLLFLIDRKRLSSATINVHINAWKFYQEKVLQREKEFYDIAYPRQARKLPTVYSVDEIKAIFSATTSLKYRTLFKLVYATGLRLSEVARLRLADLDHVRRLITVRGGKGKKDRVVYADRKNRGHADRLSEGI